MRRVSAVLSVAAVVLMAGGVFAQGKPSFAGEWKMTADADSGGGRGGPGADLAITQSATAMTVQHRPGGQPSPKLTYNLDGSVSKNMTAGRGGGAPIEQVSRATWAGNRLVVTTATAGGDEKRTFSMDGAVSLSRRRRRRATPEPRLSRR